MWRPGGVDVDERFDKPPNARLVSGMVLICLSEAAVEELEGMGDLMSEEQSLRCMLVGKEEDILSLDVGFVKRRVIGNSVN